MTSLVAIVDYGMGNLRSVSQALKLASQSSPSVEVVVTQDPDVVKKSDRMVLPGQGAMPDCMKHLSSSGLLEAVLENAKNKPLLGICVGMQMLLEHSQEGPAKGLGLIAGGVFRFDLAHQKQPDGSRYKVPQMGWNQVKAKPVYKKNRHPIFQHIQDDTWFYFVHSYYAKPLNDDHVAAVTDYGGEFCVALACDNLVATQFHPEKSSTQGVLLYQNFLHWSP